MTHVLITGGAGYVGSHTAKALKRAGYEPVVYDNLSTGVEKAVQFGPFERGDLLDNARLAEVMHKYAFKAVFHLAARESVPESFQIPMDYYDTNLVGSLNVIRAALAAKVPHFIFSSSAAVYGIPEALPLSEDSSIVPTSPQGRTKRMVEAALLDMQAAYDLTSVSLRYFNAVGADPELDVGLYREAETPTLLPKALQALKTDKPVKIFGREYPTKDGTCVRDYIHVSDIADAHVAALSYLLKDGRSTQVNVGTGVGYTVLEILQALGEIAGKPVPMVDAPARAGDPPILVASVKEMLSILRFKPQYSDLKTILKTAYDFSQTL